MRRERYYRKTNDKARRSGDMSAVRRDMALGLFALGLVFAIALFTLENAS